MKTENIKKITVLAMIAALSFLAMFFFRFNVSFLTFDFKDAIMSVSALIYGPIAGVIVAVLVALIEFFSISDTGVYGLIMNILSSAAFVFACGLVYKYKRNFAGAIIAAVCSIISVTAIMLLANLFITPYYLGVEITDIINLLPSLLLPFNLSKAIMNAAVMLLIYKPLTTALKTTGLLRAGEKATYKFDLKTILLILISIVIIVLTTLFIIIYLNGNFQFM